MVTTRTVAEDVLRTAGRHRLNLLRGRALCILAELDMLRGDLDQAAARVAEAVHIASSDDHGLMMAYALNSEGALAIMLGDMKGAVEKLTLGYARLEASGDDQELYLCQLRLALCGDALRQWEMGLHWCALSRETARRAGFRFGELRSDSVDILLRLDEVDSKSKGGVAAETLRPALEQVCRDYEALLGRLDVRLDPWLWIWTTGNLGAALSRLGRFDEARQALARAFEVPGMDSAPLIAGGASVVRRDYEAELVQVDSRQGRHSDALRRVQALIEAEAGLAMAPRKDLHLNLGIEVAEKAGRIDLALAWCRQLIDLDRLSLARRAAQVSRIKYAQSTHQRLSAELSAARRELQQLTHQRDELIARRAGHEPSPTGLHGRGPGRG